MRPIYYIPHAAGAELTAAELTDLGLAYALDHPQFAGVTRGPSATDEPGPPGLVASEQGDPRPPKYLADVQTWRPLVGDVWVGIYTDNPPTPAELARPEQLPGYLVPLADGRPWHVPCARRWFDGDEPTVHCVLPRSMDYTAGSGWAAGDVKPRYRALWRLVEDYTRTVAAALGDAEDDPRTEVRFRFDALDELAVGALQMNYRVGPVELAMLGAYDEQSRKAIIDHVLDNPAWVSLVKKKLCVMGPAAGSG